MNRRPASRNRGFSLTEILVAILVIAVLMTVMLPVINTQIDRARGTRCLSRLRQLGVLVTAYAADHQNKLSFFRDGTTSKMWYDELRKHAGLSEEAARKAFGCPSLPEDKVTNWVCYGFRVGKAGDNDVGATVRPEDADGNKPAGFFEIPILKVAHPSRYFLMGDTGTVSGSQTFRIIAPGLYSNGGIQTRHQERANFLFLDGHVEPLDKAGIKALGITTVLNKEGVATSTEL